MSIPQTGGAPIENFEQLMGYLESGCKPIEDWRIGTEHEKFGYFAKNHQPIRYAGGILPILEKLADDFNWDRVYEADHLIGLQKGGANISLEPGGQLELSGAPLKSVFETCDEAGNHLSQVRAVCDPMGIEFIGLGAAPEWQHADMGQMPKGRYKLMTDYMDRVGEMGKIMMYRTTTVQVNLDFSSEADMVKKLRVALSLQPVANALFANSPFFEGKPNGFSSWRGKVWHHTDNARTGMLPFVFDEGFGFEQYVDYALDVPMYFVYRDGNYVDARGQRFRDFLKGELPALPGQKPLISDWADHLTTLFPEARIKKFMEMRGADGGPWSNICALPAFWVGLMYDDTALNEAYELVKDWTNEMRDQLRLDAAKHGLRANVNGQSMNKFAETVLQISASGLARRGIPSDNQSHASEAMFLEPLIEMVESGKNMADELLVKYNNEWAQDLSKIYEEYRY